MVIVRSFIQYYLKLQNISHTHSPSSMQASCWMDFQWITVTAIIVQQ